MRLILLTLLLVVAVDGGIFDGLKTMVSGVKNVGHKIKNVTIVGFKKLFNNTAFFKVRDKLRSIKSKVAQTLELTPDRMKALWERLKKMRLFKRDKVNEKGDCIEEVNEKNNITGELYQVDMLLTEDQAEEIVQGVNDTIAEMESATNGTGRFKRQAFKDQRYPAKLWSEGVKYYFHSFASTKMRNAFLKGAKLWEKDTCIDFAQSRVAKDRIMVFPEQGCWSYVGRLGGEQKLSLGSGCESIGTAAHEIGHALGFFHTHSRYDRDEHITVVKSHIKVDWLDQFTKQTPTTNDNYGLEYDYGSVMHYGGNSASFNKKPTMVPNDVDYQQTLGSPFISFIDLDMLNQHYNCKERCNPAKSAKCEMGGFPHPRNCQKCICPGGYGGDLCNERPPGCGETIRASEKWTRFEDEVGLGGDEVEDFMTCNYWIESPSGTEIEVKVIDFTKGVSVDGCKYAGFEVKTNEDQKMSGYRFCSEDAVGLTLRSYSNRVPIMTWNRYWKTKTVLEYRHVPARGGPSRPKPKPVAPKLTPRPSLPSTTRPSIAATTRRPPVVQSSSSSPVRTGTGFKCVDSVSCWSLVKRGFCNKMGMTNATIIKVCPKACGWC